MKNRMKNTITNKISLFASIALLAITCFSACKKTPNNNSNTPTFTNTNKVTASVSGQIVDESGAAVAGAQVQLANNITISDIDGFFQFVNVECATNATLITATKTGNFPAYRTLHIAANKNHMCKLTMLAMDNPQSLNVSSGGTISADGGAQITFSPNSLVVAGSSTPYTGTATIFAKTIKADDPDIANLTPGALRGVTEDGLENVLTTYGMLGVEMLGASGEVLQIAPNKTAEIKIPIASNQLANAPSEIQLWHFDKTLAMWKEEGKANKVGAEYVGNVSHFSFWNCDMGLPLCGFTATVVDAASGAGLGGYKVELVSNSGFAGTRYNITAANGSVIGSIPTNSSYTINVIDVNCNGVLYSSTFNSTTTAVSLGTIAITIPTVNLGSINGTGVTCSGAPLTNGSAFMNMNGNIIPISVSNTGALSWTGLLCNASTPVTIKVYDIAGVTNGTYNINLIQGVNNVGPLAACGALSQFHNYTIDDGTTVKSYSLVAPTQYFTSAFDATMNGGTTQILGESGGKINTLTFNGNGTTGNHALTYFFDYTSTLGGSATYVQSDSLVPINVPITITAYGSTMNSMITGSYNGSFVNGASSYTINGSFAVERQF
jgi:hypothetical protein